MVIILLVFQLCRNKVIRTGKLNNRIVFSHTSGGCKTHLKLWSALVSSKASLALPMLSGPLPLSLHGRSSLCVWALNSSYKDTCCFRAPLSHLISVITCLEILRQVSSHYEVIGVRTSTYDFGRGTRFSRKDIVITLK